MSTTALFIELLITGLQAAIWLTLIVLTILGFDWISLERLKGFEAMFAVLLLPIVYPVGIFIDYLADVIFSPWERRIRTESGLDKAQSALKLLMQTKEPTLAAHFGYIRSRIRISRSSALNFALIAVTSLAFTATRCRSLPAFPFWRVVLLEVLTGATLALLAGLTWRHLTYSFHKWVVKGYNAGARFNESKTTEDSLLDISLSSSDRV